MDLQSVLEGLVAAAETVDNGLRKVIGLPYMPDAVEPPCVVVADVVMDFDQAMARGLDRATVTLLLVTSNTDDREGFELLMTMLAGSGPTSMKAAIESSRGEPGQAALDGACDDYHVQKVTGLRRYPFGSSTYLGCEFTVMCIGSGG